MIATCSRENLKRDDEFYCTKSYNIDSRQKNAFINFCDDCAESMYQRFLRITQIG